MRDIYSKARAVVVWTGPERDESHKAMALMRALALSVQTGRDDELSREIVRNSRVLGVGGWGALEAYMQRDYWDRLWIMQELTMGTDRHRSSAVITVSRGASFTTQSVCSVVGTLT